MDSRSWTWRKKSLDEMVVATDNVDPNLSSRETDEEVKFFPTAKTELEKNLHNLNERLAFALSDCNAKDDLVKKHAKVAQEAIIGWEKAEAEAISVKQELDLALQQCNAVKERSAQLDGALKECMQQLRFVREEQEQRIKDAVLKTSRDYEKTNRVLEVKLAETTKRLAKIAVENTHLSKSLKVKDSMIKDIDDQRIRLETECTALLTRLDATEKDYTSLKYEVQVLEKELEIRNEEREFNRRTSDASHKQHLENVKKIAKLESESQRLRLLLRKRLPGPAALAKMKNEVDMLGRDSTEMRRKKMTSSPTDLPADFTEDFSPETPSKQINSLMEQMYALEEENKHLKEALSRKINELQLPKTPYARADSRLSQVETRLEESSNWPRTNHSKRSGLVSEELSLASMPGTGNDDKVSCGEIWASALVSELEHFKNGKQKCSSSCKTGGASEISLMDDFIEMEKLAVISADKPFRSSQASLDEVDGTLETESSVHSEVINREIVPSISHQSESNALNQEIPSKEMIVKGVSGWLQDVMKIVLGRNLLAQKSPDQILEDIRVAMLNITVTKPNKLFQSRETVNTYDASASLISSCHTVSCTQPLQLDTVKSITKIIELIEGINLLSSADQDASQSLCVKSGSFLTGRKTETPTGYVVRVFQWKTSELNDVLQDFLHACNDLLKGKKDVQSFALASTSALDWVMNHCFSIQDVSSMRDEIKKQFGWDDTRSESEVEVGMSNHFPEANPLHAYASFNRHNILYQLEEPSEDDYQKMKHELITMDSSKKQMEERLQSAIYQHEHLLDQLKRSEVTKVSLQEELEALKESKRMAEDQIESLILMNEDLDTQLTVVRVELNEACLKTCSLEVELENRINCFEESEETCIELQLQLESVMHKETEVKDISRKEKQLQTDREITAASEKLAECQETILNLGKQLKALASPREAALFDKVVMNPSGTATTIPTSKTATNAAVANFPAKKKLNRQRSSLLDHMQAEDNAKAKDMTSPKTKEEAGTAPNPLKPGGFLDHKSIGSLLSTEKKLDPMIEFDASKGSIHKDDGAAVDSLAIVPIKQQGGRSLWRRLFWRRTKSSNPLQ